MSNADLEVAYLRQESGITGPATLPDLREAVYGTDEYAYFAALSGLTEGSLSDLAKAFWTLKLEA